MDHVVITRRLRPIGQPLTARTTVMQASGNYGTMWPVFHQQLGISPDLGLGGLEVVPQVPAYAQGLLTARNVRLGTGSIDVSAERTGNQYVTDVTSHIPAHLTVGQALLAGTTITSVELDGHAVPYTVQDTNRGREVLVVADSDPDAHLLVMTR